VIVIALLGVAFLIRLGPALTLALALVRPDAERWLAPVLDEVRAEETSVTVDGGHLAADLYRPRSARGALLLVHGLTPAGHRHPELVRLARLFAAHHWLVLVPRFEGLAAFKLSGREVTEIRTALRSLSAQRTPVAVAGLSFGAGPTLLAAADVPDLAFAASFGGYADLRDVMLYLTTGVHHVGGRRYVQPQEEYNRWKLLALLVGFVHEERDRRILDAVARHKLADPGVDTDEMEVGLGPEGQAIRALVLNRREDALPALLAALPAGARAALDDLSPLRAVPRLHGRLLIAHGAGDVSIPFTQSLRLAEASGGRAHAVIFETFAHTTARTVWSSLGGRLRDGRRLLGLADALLPPR
jgi:dienelactone hydrolase